jgi:hypothetical protein
MRAIYDVIGTEVGKPDDVWRLGENKAVVRRYEDIGRPYICENIIEDRPAT